MNNWLYKDKVIEKIEDLPENTFGFIYKITNFETGKFYIGKKQLMSFTNIKMGKKELAEQPIQRGRKVTKKQVIKESNWKEYWGSNKFLLDDIKKSGYENFTREILIICSTKKLLTYWELAIQCKYDVLQSNSYNDNILGKFYIKDFLI
jgi:hypothetical protein